MIRDLCQVFLVIMKTHLPLGLRRAILSGYALFSPFVTTLATSALCVGSFGYIFQQEQAQAAAANLYWIGAGSDNAWDTSETFDWKADSSSGVDTAFTQGDHVFFTNAGTKTTIQVNTPNNIEVMDMTIDGANYTFTSASPASIVVMGDLSVIGTGASLTSGVQMDLSATDVTIGSNNTLNLTNTGDISIQSLSNSGTFTASSDLKIEAVREGGILRTTGDVDLSSMKDTVTFTELDANTVTVNKLSIGNKSSITNLHETTQLTTTGTVSIDTIQNKLDSLHNTGSLAIDSYLTLDSFYNEGSVTLTTTALGTLDITNNVTEGGTVKAYDMKLKGTDYTFDQITLDGTISTPKSGASLSVGTSAGTASSIEAFSNAANSLTVVENSSLTTTSTEDISLVQLSGKGSLSTGGNLLLTGNQTNTVGSLTVSGSLTTSGILDGGALSITGALVASEAVTAASLKASSITLGDNLTVLGDIDASSLTSISIDYDHAAQPAIKASKIDFGSSTHQLSFNISNDELLDAELKDGDSYILAQLTDASGIDAGDFTLNNMSSVQIGSAQFTIEKESNNITISMTRVGNAWKVADGNGSWAEASEWTDGYSPSTPGSASADALLIGTLSSDIQITLGPAATATSILVETQDGSSAYVLKEGVLTTNSLQVTQGTLKLQSAEVALQNNAEVVIGTKGVLDIDANSTLVAKQLQLSTNATFSTAGEVTIDRVDAHNASITNTGSLTLGNFSAIDALYGITGRLITQSFSSVSIGTIENQILTLAERSVLYTSNDVTLQAMEGEGSLNLTHANSQLTIADGSTGVVSGSISAEKLNLGAGSTAAFNTLSINHIIINGDLSTDKSMLKADSLFPKAIGGQPSLSISSASLANAVATAQTSGMSQTYYIYEQTDAKWSVFDLSQMAGDIYTHVEAGVDVLLTQDGTDKLTLTIQESTDRTWNTANNFAATPQEDNQLSILSPILNVSGRMDSLDVLDTVDKVVVSQDSTIDISHLGAGTLTLSNLWGEVGTTLDLIGSGANEIKLSNSAYSAAQSDILAKDVTLKVESLTPDAQLFTGTLQLDNATLDATGADITVTGLSNTAAVGSVVKGIVNINGADAAYTGSYEDATINMLSGGDQSLKAGTGLTITGAAGRAVITHAANAQMSAIRTSGADVVIDFRDAASDQSLTLTQTSTMDGGTLGILLNENNLEAGETQQIFSASSEQLTLSADTKLMLQLDSSVESLTLSSSSNYDIELIKLSTNLTLSDSQLGLDGILGKYFTDLSYDSITGIISANIRLPLASYTEMSISANGYAGGVLLDVVSQQGSAADTDLASVLDSINGILAQSNSATSESDRILAGLAGAGVTSLGSAALSNIEGQLMRMRNRTGGFMPAGESNFWISAEAGRNELESEGTAAGHNIDNWGGSVGADWGIAENTSLGFALTALYGDLDASSVDSASGDLDSYYLSLAAQHQRGNWQHKAFISWGLMDASLNRHVSHANGSYSTSGDTDGYSFGVMYELGYDIKLSESSTLIPVFSAALVHSYLDSYTESGSDAALHVGEQENTIATFGVGTRFESRFDFGMQIGARALLKVDAGDRAQEADVSLTNVAGSHARIKGAEAGPVGVELGLGASMPVSEKSSLFFDASVDLRDDQQNCSASAGYRLSF